MEILVLCTLIVGIIGSIIGIAAFLEVKRLSKSKTKDLNLILEELDRAFNENNLEVIGAVSDKLSFFENRQLKELLENKMQIVSKLDSSVADINKNFLDFQGGVAKYINESNIKLTDSMSNNFDRLTSKIDDNLTKINNKVEERLNEGFEKTNKTFANVLERLSKIDEAQKKIDSLSTNIVSLQDILTDKKARGTFGEVQLNNILISVFGEGNDKIYKLQHKLSNGSIADSIVFTPEPIGAICIDSKFPLENYQKMIDTSLSDVDRSIFKKEFSNNVKKHITDISDKYLIAGETADQAIMFVPAEAIFAQINAYHQDIIDFASSKKVWLASPTTLMAVLSTIQVVLKNIEREQYSTVIHAELNKLGEEFKRYKSRWDALAKDIRKVSDDVENINITSNKIEKKFNSISLVEIKNTDVGINIEETIEENARIIKLEE